MCRELGVGAVIGTTGFTDAQKAEIAEFSLSIPIMMAPNMSVGVNVTLKLLEMAAKAMATGYDIESLKPTIATRSMRRPAPPSKWVKSLPTPSAATSRTVRFMPAKGLPGSVTLRALVLPPFAVVTLWAITPYCFAGIGERIEISHKSSSRTTYAQGSLRAVRFLAGKTSGFV